MIRYMPWIAAPFFALAACDSDSGSSDTTDTTGGDTTTGDTNVPAGTSALTGVNTNVTKTDPNPGNVGCGSTPISNTAGAKYPWGGETVAGRTYTCNVCRGGVPDAQGVWRLHGWSLANGNPCPTLSDPACNENYSEPKAGDGDFSESIWIDGNTFRIHQKNGSAAPDLVLKGYYFCGSKPEGPQEHVVWKILEATPSGLPGLSAGDFLESDKLGVSGPGPSTYWYEALNSENTGKNDIGTYCSYGSKDPYDNVCADPFGETPPQQ